MAPIFTIKSNARRAARKAGVNPEDVFCLPNGWSYPDPPAKQTDTAPLPLATDTAPFVSVPPPTAETAAATPSAPENTNQGEPEMSTAKPKRTRKKAAAKPARKAATKTRERGLGDQVIAALKERWTPIDDLIKLTGWLPHTTRAFISVQTRKLGLTAERRRVEGVTSYRIAS